MFIAALFTVAKLWKQPKCQSADEWMFCGLYKTTIGHLNSGIQLCLKKEKNNLGDSMVVTKIMLNEISR